MKHILVVLFLALSTYIYSQDVSKQDNLIYDIRGITLKPEFPDGIDNLNSLIALKLKAAGYQLPAKSKTFAVFVIEHDGALSDIQIVGISNSHIVAELVRILEDLPKWNPGKLNSAIVRVKYALAIK